MAEDAGGPASGEYFARAQRSLVGGVNSPVRSYRAVGGPPVVVERAKGPWIWDLDGRRYADYVMSWGPLIAGHAPPTVLSAVRRAAARGTSFGACHPLEAAMAERVREHLPSCEKLRFTSSGTEAAMTALRIARGATGRDRILKFEGCYHGHADAFLVKAGSGAETLGIPDSQGVPASVAGLTITAPYNDLAAAEAVFQAHPRELAAVFVEPIAGNMGLVPPVPGFLEGLRRLCDRHGTVLVFDEVITGFRVGLGGAQERLKVRPDLTCLGKVVGGGFPAAAVGGRRELMEELAPLGGVYQAGTLSGNPVALAAGLATLDLAARPGFYEGLADRARQLAEGWGELFASARRPAQVLAIGGLVGVFFSATPVRNLAEAQASDTTFFRRWFHAMLGEGVLLAPSPFEALFVSSAHSTRVLTSTLHASARALERLKRG